MYAFTFTVTRCHSEGRYSTESEARDQWCDPDLRFPSQLNSLVINQRSFIIYSTNQSPRWATLLIWQRRYHDAKLPRCCWADELAPPRRSAVTLTLDLWHSESKEVISMGQWILPPSFIKRLLPVGRDTFRKHLKDVSIRTLLLHAALAAGRSSYSVQGGASDVNSRWQSLSRVSKWIRSTSQQQPSTSTSSLCQQPRLHCSTDKN